jgi:hypothetical protein
MAQTLNAVPQWAKCDSHPGRPDSYPWDSWFNGEAWLLTEGKDYQTESRFFRHTVLRAARRRNLTVICSARRTEDNGHEILVKNVKALV